MRPVRDWIANVALAALVAVAMLLLAPPAQGQTTTWKVDGPASCTVTCLPAATQPPPGPVDPTPPPPPDTPAADPCAQYAGNFMLYSYCRQGGAKPGPIGDSSGPSLPTTGFVLANRGRPLTNTLTAAVTHAFSVPTECDERVELTILEVVGTPDSMQTTSSVRGPTGELLSGPSIFGRHGSHTVTSPCGTLTFNVTPTVTAPLGVQRN